MPKDGKPKQNSPCCTWDFTLGSKGIVVPDLRKHLSRYCKAYAFQLEKGNKTGYDHYQGRIKLKVKDRKNGVVASVATGIYKDMSLSVTSNENRDNTFYVMKEDTRVDGPWTDQDRLPVKAVEKMVELLPWQKDLCEKLSQYNDREIHIVVDKKGNCGKSSFVKWMYFHKNAMKIPSTCQTAKDMTQFAMSFPVSSIYLIDMPRAQKKKALFELYSFIEELKNGWLYDTRYQGKMVLMDEPQICIFTNTPPKKRYLSMDRWRMWTVEDEQLKVFKYDEKKE